MATVAKAAGQDFLGLLGFPWLSLARLVGILPMPMLLGQNSFIATQGNDTMTARQEQIEALLKMTPERLAAQIVGQACVDALSMREPLSVRYVASVYERLRSDCDYKAPENLKGAVDDLFDDSKFRLIALGFGL